MTCSFHDEVDDDAQVQEYKEDDDEDVDITLVTTLQSDETESL